MSQSKFKPLKITAMAQENLIKELLELGFKEGHRSELTYELRNEISSQRLGDYRPFIEVHVKNTFRISIGADEWNMCDAPGVKTLGDLKDFIRLCGY